MCLVCHIVVSFIHSSSYFVVRLPGPSNRILCDVSWIPLFLLSVISGRPTIFHGYEDVSLYEKIRLAQSPGRLFRSPSEERHLEVSPGSNERLVHTVVRGSITII